MDNWQYCKTPRSSDYRRHIALSSFHLYGTYSISISIFRMAWCYFLLCVIWIYIELPYWIGQIHLRYNYRNLSFLYSFTKNLYGHRGHSNPSLLFFLALLASAAQTQTFSTLIVYNHCLICYVANQELHRLRHQQHVPYAEAPDSESTSCGQSWEADRSWKLY